MKHLQIRSISTMHNKNLKNPLKFTLNHSDKILKRRKFEPIPIPHRTMPEPKGEDLDFVNIAHSHLIHSDWKNLDNMCSVLNPFRMNHILLKTRKDFVLSREFFLWVCAKNASCVSLDSNAIMLHILTKYMRFQSAEVLLRRLLGSASGSVELFDKLFNAVVYSYRMCDSSPRVFDSLFKTYAHLRKFGNARSAFCRMKEYGILPTVVSCNALLSSMMRLDHVDVAFQFYREMCRCMISPNVFTVNMVMEGFCKSGKLEKAVELFRKMESMGVSPNVASFNILIGGYCKNGLVSTAIKLKRAMEEKQLLPSVVSYNILLNCLCKERKLHEAGKLFHEMKAKEVPPDIVTYNTMINGYSLDENCEMGSRLYEEMLQKGIKADILTYNALILGLCKAGKTKNAAFLVKELDRNKLVPNASTFSALISGQCAKKNSGRAFQLYDCMKRSGCQPNESTLIMLISTFMNNQDFDGAIQFLKELLKINKTPEPSVLSDLCTGLRSCGKQQEATDLCKEIESRKLMPEGFYEAL